MPAMKRAITAAAPALTLLLAFPSGAAEQTLYGLPCNPGPGIPLGGLVLNSAGELTGAASTGGFDDLGALFQLAPPAKGNGPWNERTIYSFGVQTEKPPASDAADPQSAVLLLHNGKLIGTGFASDDTGCGGSGCGAIYLMTPPRTVKKAWKEQVLYNFRGGADGDGPAAELLNGAQGVFYGTTEYGGAGQAGTVFELSPPAKRGGAWTEQPIYAFTGGTDGGFPVAALIADASGALYGTAPESTNGGGTVFRLTPPAKGGGAWTETTLYGFGVSGLPGDGDQPEGPVALGPDGSLYGTTQFGGFYGRGVVFQLSPPSGGGAPWTETILYSFQDNGDGALPAGPLLLKGKDIYGTTQGSGRGTSVGAVFRLVPQSGGTGWKESSLYNFTGNDDGAYPLSGVIADKSGNLYGTTSFAGVSDCGTVFEITK